MRVILSLNMSILVTITGHSEQEVEWRSKEMTKLLSSQDIGTGSCIFREEQAFLSSLPFLQIDKNIYEKSKRNVLTSGVAACYPFASYEMSDKDCRALRGEWLWQNNAHTTDQRSDPALL